MTFQLIPSYFQHFVRKLQHGYEIQSLSSDAMGRATLLCRTNTYAPETAFQAIEDSLNDSAFASIR